jgi:hypothetical protein
VRNASFARFLPRLLVKFARIPAMFGGLMIGGVAWIQYQAIRKIGYRNGDLRDWLLTWLQRSATRHPKCTRI